MDASGVRKNRHGISDRGNASSRSLGQRGQFKGQRGQCSKTQRARETEGKGRQQTGAWDHRSKLGFNSNCSVKPLGGVEAGKTK